MRKKLEIPNNNFYIPYSSLLVLSQTMKLNVLKTDLFIFKVNLFKILAGVQKTRLVYILFLFTKWIKLLFLHNFSKIIDLIFHKNAFIMFWQDLKKNKYTLY